MLPLKIILLVEDSKSARMVVRYTIEPMGYELVEAEDGQEGLATFEKLHERNTPPALIITDVNMPNMDGYEFVRMVRTLDVKTPILYLTSHASEESRQLGRQAGANGWIVKPFTADSIRKTILGVISDT